MLFPFAMPPTTSGAALAFSLGGPEVLIIAAVIILFFGASKMPELMKNLARSAATVKHEHDTIMSEVDKVKGAVTREIDDVKQAASLDPQIEDDEPDQSDGDTEPPE